MLRKLLLRDNSRNSLDSVFQSLASSASKWQTSFHAMLSKRRIQTNKLLTSWPQAKTLLYQDPSKRRKMASIKSRIAD
jgi:hypothetical protein